MSRLTFDDQVLAFLLYCLPAAPLELMMQLRGRSGVRAVAGGPAQVPVLPRCTVPAFGSLRRCHQSRHACVRVTSEQATQGKPEQANSAARQLLGMKGAALETDKFKIRVQLTKPVTWIPLIWGVACGAAASGNYVWNNPTQVAQLLTCMMMSGPFLTGYTQTINDWYDREIDAINEPYRPIPSGVCMGTWCMAACCLGLTHDMAPSIHHQFCRITEGEVKAQVAALLGAGIGTAFLLDTWVGHEFPTLTVLALFGSFISYIYSAPPLKLKQSGWAGNYALGSSYIALPWWAGQALFGTLTPDVMVLTVAYSIAGLGIAIVNDFKSIEGDRAMGLQSLPVAFGVETAKYICVASIDVTQLGVAAYLWQGLHQPTYAAVLLGLILPQIFFQFKYFLPDPIANDVKYQSASSIPLSVAKLAWHAWRGKEDTTLQRLGLSSIKRSAGPLIWLHASTVAECAVALPVLIRCLLEYNDKVHIMLTVACADALKLLQGALPTRVILQMVPLDNPVSATMFMRHWRPQVGILMESPFLPSLVAAARRYGVKLALLNARMSTEDLLKWHTSRGRRRMLKQMVDSFSLIIPQSDMDVGHFRIFGTSTRIMPGWCSDLQHAAALASGVWQLWTPKEERVRSLQQKLAGRPCWLAAHTEAGEEEVVAELHAALAPHLPGLLTLVLPSGQERCAAVLEVFRGQGLATARWSDKPRSYSSLDVLLVDELEQLSLIYSVVEVVVMGGSLIPGRPPHNLTQAAVAGCALLLGPHAANGPAELMAEQLNAAAWVAAEEAAAAVQSAGKCPVLSQAMEDYSGSGNARMAGGSFSSPPRLRRSGSTAVTASSARPSQHLHLLSGDDSFGDLAITTSVVSDSCRSRGPAPGPHPPSQLHPHTPQRR
ncbi:hypothetical protein QJQ45_019133, partial [Haematococcus lacustris]